MSVGNFQEQEVEAAVTDSAGECPVVVLMVDDQPIVGEAIRRALLNEPRVSFHYCADPAGAIAVAKQVKPTVILQDLVMPGVNGLDFIDQYRADPATNAIPIIVLSSKEDPKVKSDAFKAGANDYLVKLPDRVELIARVLYHSMAYTSQLQRDDAYRREKELERRLMHSQKLEALGTLAGGVAHDLNNTLVPIVTLSRLALDDLPEDSPVRGDLETIIQASERARDLVKQILAFSRKEDLVKQEVDLALVMREALHMLRAGLPATIQIVEQICDVPPLFGDAGQLNQVVVNLVTNAAQAIGGKVGNITVRVWAGCEAQPSPHMSLVGPAVCLSVADTGCGMDEATLNRVFEPFFTTKGVGEGTGLGLSVVHGIVTAHGGKITVQSKLGEGTEFSLSLPALDPRETTAPFETAA